MASQTHQSKVFKYKSGSKVVVVAFCTMIILASAIPRGNDTEFPFRVTEFCHSPTLYVSKAQFNISENVSLPLSSSFPGVRPTPNEFLHLNSPRVTILSMMLTSIPGLSQCDLISHPEKSYFHRSGSLFLDCTISNPKGSAIITVYWCWWLCVAKFL